MSVASLFKKESVHIEFNWDIVENPEDELEGTWIRLHLPEPRGEKSSSFLFATRLLGAYRRILKSVEGGFKSFPEANGVYIDSWIVGAKPRLIKMLGFTIPDCGSYQEDDPEYDYAEWQYAYMKRTTFNLIRLGQKIVGRQLLTRE